MTQKTILSTESGSIDGNGGFAAEMLVDISDKVFRDREIRIDGYRFINCGFQNCRLRVHLGIFEFHRCLKTGGTVVFHGKALRCVRLFQTQDDSESRVPHGFPNQDNYAGRAREPFNPGEGRSRTLPNRLLRFYLTMFITMFSALALMFITLKSADPLMHYGGPIISGHILVALIIFALYHYFIHGKASQVGNQNSISEQQASEILKETLPGHDENLCPDGIVTGDACREEYSECSEDEKKAFMRSQEQILREKRHRSLLFLQLLSSAAQEPFD